MEKQGVLSLKPMRMAQTDSLREMETEMETDTVNPVMNVVIIFLIALQIQLLYYSRFKGSRESKLIYEQQSFKMSVLFVFKGFFLNVDSLVSPTYSASELWMLLSLV